MSHRSGLKEHAFNPALQQFFWFPMTTDKIIELEAGKTPDFDPGTAYAYVNFNYVLVAHVIEKVTGMPFVKFTNDQIFARHKIKGAYFAERDKIIPRRAEFYHVQNGQAVNAIDVDLSHVSAAGAFLGSADALGQWLWHVTNADIISKADQKSAWTAAPLPDGKPTHYGLGFNMRSLCGQEIIWHTGLTAGAQAAFAIIPSKNITILLMTNNFNAPNTGEAMRDTAAILWGDKAGVGWDGTRDKPQCAVGG